MPTNVTREYLEAQEKYREARTQEEKVEALKLMLSTVPKHKGTERLRYELKKNLAKQRRELEARRLKKVTSHSDFHVAKEGIAQVALIGPPNSGKSLILNRLTGARAKVASYPFTSTKPLPGMMQHEDVQIQLVEMPALVEDVSEGKWIGPKMLSTMRNADALVMVLDLSGDPVREMEVIREELEAAGIRLNRRRPGIVVKRTDRGGIQIEGEVQDADKPHIVDLLQSRGYHNASLLLLEKVSREDLADALDESLVYKKALVLANKGDRAQTQESYERLVDRLGKDFPTIPISAKEGIGMDNVARAIYALLDVVRVYTKVPGQRPERRPLVLRNGSSVQDVAESLHRRFVDNFRFARVWGSSVNFGGEMVGLAHVLEDRDTVEFHAR